MSDQKMIFPVLPEQATKLPFYVIGIGSMTNQHYALRTSGLPFHQFLFTTKGRGLLRIDNKEFEIEAHTGFYFEPGTPHEYFAIEEPWATCWIVFNGEGVRNLLKLVDLEDYSVFYVREPELLKLHHNELYTSIIQPGPSSATDASHLFYKLLLALPTCIAKETRKTGRFKDRHLQAVLMYVESHFQHPVTLADMADIAGISPQHLCRLFKQCFNMRPFEYLTKYRLQRAKEILTGSEKMTLREIAFRTGFNDTSYFCSVFKRHEGVTPLEYAKRHLDF